MTVEQAVGTAGVRVPGRRRSRRQEILEIAVGLFATRGYHGVSMDDIGAAAGVTGPALYHHFAGKEAMLVGRAQPGQRGAAGRRPGPGRGAPRRRRRGAGSRWSTSTSTFALANPAVIALHLHELDRLPEEPRRQIRRLQRLYVEEWVGVADRRCAPSWPPARPGCSPTRRSA